MMMMMVMIMALASESDITGMDGSSVGIAATEVVFMPKKKVAVCITGLRRFILEAMIQDPYHCHVVRGIEKLGAEVDTYISISKSENQTQADIDALRQSLIKAYKAVSVRISKGDREFPTDYENRCDVDNGRILRWGAWRDPLTQFIASRDCYHQIEAKEAKEGFKYDWIFRMRTDQFFLQDIHIPFDDRNFVYVPHGGMDGSLGQVCLNDHSFLCPRELCRPYFELLELFESDKCVKRTNTTTKTTTTTTTTVENETVPKRYDGPPKKPFLLPPRPKYAQGQMYFLWSYGGSWDWTKDNLARAEVFSSSWQYNVNRNRTCGVIKEAPWLYSILRKQQNYCDRRMVHLWRGNQTKLREDHRPFIDRCLSLHARRKSPPRLSGLDRNCASILYGGGK